MNIWYANKLYENKFLVIHGLTNLNVLNNLLII